MLFGGETAMNSDGRIKAGATKTTTARCRQKKSCQRYHNKS